MTTPLSCAEVAERVDGYLTGALAGPGLAAVTGHLAGCRECRVAVATARELRELRGTPPLTFRLERRLLTAFRRWRAVQ